MARPQSHLHIHVSVSDLYIPTIGPPFFLQQNRQTDRGNIEITHRIMNVGAGTEVRSSFSGNICIRYCVFAVQYNVLLGFSFQRTKGRKRSTIFLSLYPK
jgi:hypothetical protein